MSVYVKLSGYFLIGLGLFILIILLYANSKLGNTTRIFSPQTLLFSSWESYKKLFINKDGRVVDFSQNDVTTSEGQSYAMLRAVWVDDRSTFDKVWTFTKNNLKRDRDNLFGWRWVKRKDGEYGFIENGGDNSASDADSDIALALLFASRRWNTVSYKEEGLKILSDIWDIETDVVKDKRYLVAANWAKGSDKIVVNPSYFAPYAWRVFAKEDKKHDWQSLIDPAYELLNRAGKDPLDKDKAVGFPPDWLEIDKTTEDLRATSESNLSTNFSFDAVRVPWRIGLDYQWNKDKRAYDYLFSSFGELQEFYLQEKKLYSVYSHDGQAIRGAENPVMYASSLGYFLAVKPELATSIYQDKILKLYSNQSNTFKQNLPYYEQNWLWFGAALYNKFLIPYTK